MVKALVMGAGAQNGPCASILAGEENVNEVRLGNINLDTVQKVAPKIGSAKFNRCNWMSATWIKLSLPRTASM